MRSLIRSSEKSGQWGAKFILATLDALSTQLAVLDAQGTIIAVNEAWRRFARCNGAAEKADFVGENYVGICERASSSDPDGTAARMLSGLREVLSGQAQCHQLEYPCHAPGEQRWFIARVSRYEVDGVTYAVVWHEDITARKLAEIEVTSGKRALEQVNRELQKALEREQVLARTDPLTGLSNRRHFVEQAAAELERSRRYGRVFALAVIDIDLFKGVNDRFGHLAGDAVLSRFGALVRAHVRATDIAGRFGGEEFVLLLRDTDLAQAAQSMARLRAAVEGTAFETPAGAVHVTISAGIAQWRPGQTLDAMFRGADRALYAAKAEGRNRVITDAASTPPAG
ncbi:MAG: diguanylate cyclase [Nevskiales bacterium]|nr:diguanylate cyclase [Nevskiales bacterium]